jgi:DNA-binding GntR family transcriptional regulator
VFEARRLIEPAVLRRLVDTLTPEKTQRLRQHVELEADARRRGDKRAVIRLSGEFHTLAGRTGGQFGAGAQHARAVHADLPDDLPVRRADGAELPARRAPDDHRRRGQARSRRAEKIMLDHLDHIEGSLQLDQSSGEADLEAIFRG